ncbi:MAG TPA: hypothetical protein D7I03_02200 [Candidatus Poseidoniales archaeon]|nr:MAG TPA: hypothetical protein D7I03_02200 [Candidatus Poseidoniales archaeon]
MIQMFSNWTYVEWLILIIDIVAVVIVVRFLRNKIKKKLDEVELRQNFQTRQRRELAKQDNRQSSEE